MKKKEKITNLFVEYPSCSTCQKAKIWLIENLIEFDARDIVDFTPNEAELKEWISKSGLDIDKWFNTNGITFKNLRVKDRLQILTDDEKIKLLASNGMLIKRPILVSEKGVLLGFKKAEWESMLLKK